MGKETVLALLLREKGRFVSGEAVSAELGITRAAIWKSISALRAQGYEIEAVPGRGYCLKALPDVLSEQTVRSFLGGVQVVGGRIDCFDTIDSTNAYLKRIAFDGAPDGTVAVAAEQTSGRGRRGRTFQSAAGKGVYLSVLLRPELTPAQLMPLTGLVAVAMSRAVDRVGGTNVQIKWTNDLVLGKKKLCGILTEIGIEAESREVDYAVVGIGINCAHAELPPEVAAMSADLETATGKKPDRSRLAAELVRSLYEMEQALFTQKDAWLAEFSAHCVTIGQDVKLVRGDEVQFAHADGIDGEAALRVTYPDGTTGVIASGEVSVRGMYGYT